MEELVIEVQAVRESIAKLVETREAHAVVEGQRDASVRELNGLMAERAGVQAQLTAREKQIAASGGEIPDEPFPEEAQTSRLNRHIRIRQERAHIYEGKVLESQGRLAVQIQELEQAWVTLGAATSALLLKEFREAATALREAQLRYRALYPYFNREWNRSAWRHFDNKLAIADPASAELIMNPLHDVRESRWPLSAQTILKDMSNLRAEVDAATGKRSAAPVSSGEENREAAVEGE